MKKQHVSLFLSLLFLLALLSCGTGRRETITGDLAIIPLPVQMEVDTGFFVLDEKTWIQSDPFTNSSFDPVKIFTEVFSAKSGYPLFTRQESIKKDDEKHLILIIRSPVQGGKESYTLRISPVGIVIHAGDEAGIFYAFQTLRQIMRLDALPDASNQHRVWTLPAVNLTGKPSFSYRGLHLDVCRHFMPVDFVKKYIDLLAYYKMNRFHWHLTDDQGWRIEIRQYPKL